MNLEILFQDEYLVAVSKPAGMLMHRSRINREETVFLLQTLRNQIGKRVYPFHRLDKATSGIVLFGLSEEMGRAMTRQFTEKVVNKTYFAILRGWLTGEGRINYRLKKELEGELQEAVTDYQCLSTCEIAEPVGRYETARYSLLQMQPKTGRMHQLRRHAAHLRHPIIGDKKHGDIHHNRFWREKVGIPNLLLHARSLEFEHPFTHKILKLEASLPPHFNEALKYLGMDWS